MIDSGISPADRPKGRRRILVVEDNPDDVLFVRRALRRSDDAILHAETVADAMVICAKESPDAVLLDLGLPDSHGLTGLRRLHAGYPRLPIVVLTGLDDECMGTQAILAGAQDWFCKGDLDEKTLPRVITYACQRQEMLHRLHRSESSARAATMAMERTLTMVANQLRSPLLEIRACAMAALERNLVSPPGVPLLKAIGEEVAWVGELASNLIDFQRIVSGRMQWQWQTYDPAEVVAEVTSSLQDSAAASGVTLVTQTEGHAMLRGDGKAQRRLVANLVANALTHSDATTITVHCNAEAGTACYTVSDDGGGIDPAVAARLGRPFAVDSHSIPPRGAGLGLAICIGIAAAHGGHLSIHSRHGTGTRVAAVLKDLPAPASAHAPERFRELDIA
jgi:signal transduction histidine kinase